MTLEDKNNLLNEGIKKAIYFLEKNGEFYPFGLCLNTLRCLIHINTYKGDEYPSSDDVIEQLTKILKKGVNNGDYLAVAIVSDVKIRDSETDGMSDAVRIELEHKESSPITCYLPYLINEEGRLETGEIRAVPRNPFFFNDNTQS